MRYFVHIAFSLLWSALRVVYRNVPIEEPVKMVGRRYIDVGTIQVQFRLRREEQAIQYLMLCDPLVFMFINFDTAAQVKKEAQALSFLALDISISHHSSATGTRYQVQTKCVSAPSSSPR